MGKTISVIGPDGRAVAECAALLRARVERTAGKTGEKLEVIEGAGPQQRPDIVVAVVSSATPEDREVARAVAQAMGVVLLWPFGSDAPSSAWVDTPGWVWCEGVDEVCDWIHELGVDLEEWEVDARRADAERLDRVRIATRLSATRIAQEVLDTAEESERSAGNREDFEDLHSAFMVRLRLAVLEQGALFPPLPETQVQPPVRPTVVARARASLVPVAAAGIAAGLGLGTMVGRIFGVIAGIVVGLLVALAVVGARLAMLRHEAWKTRAAKESAVLRQHWAGVVTEVVARLDIPPVAPRIRNLAMEVH
ncbi:hypothetical protein QQA05_09520 [Corynebacterium macclintockiae]|uniref:hypothetical protein n=1 Tax=Corynebacterium macclintockiae TaxID=2913501 RepID=UPI0025510994|nr:hypothetical protein [Corynebacterium macclintockiae]MDK8891630.1 hypothetical protein [Corynebacterium macclintockiae]